ncbi:MAG: SMC family ATPase [Acidobacteria bacterium]|nr:SMC family ATPase [Acidobacteriota bacterium]
MRPVRLELEGFTSFAARSEIDFANLDLFAITGPTGAGKTSLLDAILYALYGITPRLGEKEVERLIHIGSKSLHVSLTFSILGRQHRVTRIRKKVTEAKLETWEDGEWVSKAGGVKDVQRQLAELLGLDFEGFTRSVILPQGEFDNFLRSDPRQRTEMLKDLLGLRIYEFMMKRANEKASEGKSKAEGLEQALAGVYAAATPELAAQLASSVKTQKEQLAEYDAGYERLNELVSQAAELKRLRAETTLQQSRLSDAKKDLTTAREEAASALRTRDECDRQLAGIDRSLQATGYNETTWTELTNCVPLARQQTRLQTELSAHRKEKQSRATELTASEQAACDAQVLLDTARAALDDATNGVSTAEATRANLPSTDLLRKQLRDLAAAESALTALPPADAVTTQLAAAESAYEHLRTLHSAGEIRRHLKAGDQCPVCEQSIKKLPAATALGALDDARGALEQARRLHAEWTQANRRLQDLRAGSGNLTVQDLHTAESLDAELAAARKRANSARDNEAAASRAAQQATHQKQLLEQQVAAADDLIRKAQEQFRETARLLAEYPNWAPLPLLELEGSLDEQNAAKSRHQALQKQRHDAQTRLNKSLVDTADLKGRELSLANRITELEASLAAGHETAKKLEDTLGVNADWDRLQASIRQVGAIRDKLRGEIIQTEGRIIETKRLMEEGAQRREEVAKLRAETAVYHELGQLLKANEFIAHVQREALKGLARAASEQLQQLSEGNYTLTLGEDANEFYVVDHRNAGAQRSVKTLSGGESFLASLSLALALSEGLAGAADERARARLDSLFIDEGISSLDPETLDTAITALSSLADGKRMVGVISHITELGERLPARIRVTKGSNGSTAIVESAAATHGAGG